METSQLDRRSKYSQKMIREALFKLLDEKNLSSITVTDVCRLADVNRGTFYKYYRDVPDLFLQIKTAFFQEIHEMMSSSDLSILDSIYLNILKAIKGNNDLVRVIQKCNDISTTVEEIKILLKENIISNIKAAKPHATYEEIEYILEFLIGGGANVINQWVYSNMSLPIEQIHKILVNATYSSLNSL